jgi:purine-binding chemotaxis protein CheW
MKKQDTGSASKQPAPTRKRAPKSSGKAALPPQEPTISLPPESGDNLLKARAIALAQELENGEIAEYVEVVVFLLAYETYGIDTTYVREVYPLKDLTPLPCTPSFVAGIVNVRGKVLSVIDLKHLFELPAQGLTDLNRVIIISDGGMEFGILADAIVNVGRIPLDEIQPSLPTLTGVREDYLTGITAERLVILDAAKLLASSNIVVEEEVG